MKQRLNKRIQSELKSGRKLFCAFVTLGFPDLKTTEKLIRGFDREGVDIVELGFPYSDPLADGPTIQYSSEKAIRKGVSVQDAFSMVKRLRRSGVEVPIIFFSYLNPVMHFGYAAFAKKAAAAGFDGVIIPDLLPDEEKNFESACRRQGLAQVHLIAPTTKPQRAAAIARKSEGFVYYVSLRGVTGARASLASDIKRQVEGLRRKTRKPFLIGFGVSSPEQARKYSRFSEGVIVGSAIVDRLRKSKGSAAPVLKYVRQMVKAVKAV